MSPTDPRRTALVGGAERLRRVLDQGQAVAVGQLAERRQIDRLAEQVHDHDRPRAVGDRRLDRIRVEVERVGSDVGEHRAWRRARAIASAVAKNVYGVVTTSSPGPTPTRLQGQQQGVGAVGHAHGVGGAELSRHLLFERRAPAGRG